MAAGLAGGLQAALTGFIAPSSFPFSQSILFLLVVVVGGAGRTLGPLVGSAVVVLLPEVLAGLAEYRLLVFGAGLLIVLWAAPGGIAGAVARLVMPRESAPSPKPDIDLALAHITGARGSLAAEGVRVAFGGVIAVAGVDMTAQPGRVTTVIGPNGAGKTTLLNLVSGFQRPDSGTVRVGGREITGQPAHEVARAGLARTFQTAQPFCRVERAGQCPPWPAARLLARRGTGGAGARAVVARRLFRIGNRARRHTAACGSPAWSRSPAPLAPRPPCCLLDEPAAGLNDADTAKLGGLLQRLARAGLAVVLVEHDMALVMSISDEIVVLDAGRRIAAGSPAVVRNDPAVKAAYLGADDAGGIGRAAARPARPCSRCGAAQRWLWTACGARSGQPEGGPGRGDRPVRP